MADDLTASGFDPALEAPEPPVAASRGRRIAVAGIALLVAVAMLAQLWPDAGIEPAAVAAADDPESVTILAGAPASIDPAKHGDLGSASYVSQLFETLTAVDPSLAVRPALAESWTIEEDGRRVVFTLREGLVFSDGSSLTASDVVRSWRRLFNPRERSPLASLIADVVGARALLSGETDDVSTLGVRADGDRRVIVDLERGGGDLPAIVSGAPFAIVPRSAGDGEILPAGGDFVGSGGYLVSEVTDDSFVLKANPRYWAGEPEIGTVRMLTTLDGASPVDAFVGGDVDVAPISFTDAGWIAYDRELGPSLRSDPSLSVTYYGFETTRAPFDDARVRRAFAQAVDWRRLAKLDELGSSVAATSLVPEGIPGRPDGDYLPPYDPAGARALLAEAGYASGAALGPVPFIANGGGYDGAIIAMLEENLGVTIDYATMDFGTYQDRLSTDPPALWSLSWVADYPGPNDFLGVLLGTGSTSNEGGWSNPDFDAAIADAGAAASPEDATAAYARALEVVRDDAPAVPVSYGTSYSLVREGLLGATQNGLGILRLAGLAWAR
ncbi:MAG TPA: peptide ABC transporter substrate-binding protein [Candidatus Limnocylindrales bacterium]|nr:peptide ABC transporter substrate-binding protein [Candidatus Limnocylindrales bacterium]